METQAKNTKEVPEDEGFEYPGEATLKDLLDIANNPKKYGFEWSAWDASSKTDKDGKPFPGGLTVLRKAFAVLPKATDAAKFGRYFGNSKLLDGYNGTSGRVASQDVARSLLLEHWHEQRAAKVTELVARLEVIKRHLFGFRKPGGGGGQRKVWIVNGVTYLNEADAIAASKHVPKIYTAFDGSQHNTALEAKQATVKFLVTEKGMTLDAAKLLVAGMPE